MKCIWLSITTMAIIVFAANSLRAYSTTFRGGLGDYCKLESIEGSFTAAKSTYRMRGSCATKGNAVLWSSEGAYVSATARVQERVVLNGNPPYRGSINTLMQCLGDPWITQITCSDNPMVQGDGEVSQVQPLLNDLAYLVINLRQPLTAAGFQYNRQTLLAKRDSDLKAEAAAMAKAQQEQERLRQSVAQKSAPIVTMMGPTILSPAAGQRFLNQSIVPIKLSPPPTWSVSMYMVNIQRKDNAGSWINHSSLPVGPAQAHSANGYTDFGAGGKDGRSLAFLTNPGSWRLNAQIAAPKQSSWSFWVEFGVMAPPTAPNALKPGVGFGRK